MERQDILEMWSFTIRKNHMLLLLKMEQELEEHRYVLQNLLLLAQMQYLIPKENILPEYLYYVVRYMHLEKYYTGATIPHIYFKDYKNEKF